MSDPFQFIPNEVIFMFFKEIVDHTAEDNRKKQTSVTKVRALARVNKQYYELVSVFINSAICKPFYADPREMILKAMEKARKLEESRIYNRKNNRLIEMDFKKEVCENSFEIIIIITPSSD